MPLVPGDQGAPLWPVGIVGSMTHCTGYRAAAVARTSDVAAVGIDAELNAALPRDVLDLVAGPEDLDGLASLPESSVAWDRLLFSAKEAVYKAWFPLTHRWLAFDDVAVTIDPEGTFSADLIAPWPDEDRGLPGALSGRWAVSPTLLVTAVVL